MIHLNLIKTDSWVQAWIRFLVCSLHLQVGKLDVFGPSLGHQQLHEDQLVGWGHLGKQEPFLKSTFLYGDKM